MSHCIKDAEKLWFYLAEPGIEPNLIINTEACTPSLLPIYIQSSRSVGLYKLQGKWSLVERLPSTTPQWRKPHEH